MQKNTKYKELFIWGICFVVVAYMMTKLLDEYEMILEGIGVLVDMTLPFLIAFFIAYALNPLVNMLQKKRGFRRSRSIMVVYMMIFILIGISSSFVMPKVYNSIVATHSVICWI